MGRLMFAAACGLSILSTVPGVHAQSAPNPSELVFTAITPCRAFLTSTALAANQARTFAISGTSAEFTAQGGPSAGCGVPASATAVAISLTSFASTGTGHLRSTAFGDPITGTQVLSFRTNQTETAGVIAGVKSSKLTIKAYAAATRIAGDITGYYGPPIQAVVYSDGAFFSKGNRITAVSKGSTGNYVLTTDRNTTECVISLSPKLSYMNAGGDPSGNQIYVVIRNLLSEGFPFYDADFFVHVSC